MTASQRVLVVDDERFFREAVRDALLELSVRCELAASGEEALKLAEDPRIEAVVLDVRLPGTSGIEVLRALREERPELRVIVLSANSDQDLVLEALRLGAADYLAKPIHDEELRLAVTRALDGTRQAADLSWLRRRLTALAEVQAQLARRAAEAEGDSRLEALAEPAVAALAEVLAAERASLLFEDLDVLRVAAMVGGELPAEDLPPTAAEECVGGLAFGADRVLRIEDIDRDDRCAGLPRRGRYATGSALLAPLSVDGRPLGVLCVADPRSGRPFSQEDATLLRLLAAQLGALLGLPAEAIVYPEPGFEADLAFAPEPGSLPDAASADAAGVPSPGRAGAEAAPQPEADSDEEQSEPAGDVEESLRLELLRAACEAMTAEVEPGPLLARALRPIAEGLLATASIYELDARTGDLVLTAQQEWGGRSDRQRMPALRGLTAVALRAGRLVAAARPADDARFDAEVDTPVDGEGGPLLVLPLAIRGRVLGLARIHPERESAASARTGEILTAALSAALRNTLLYGSLLEAVDEVAAARRR